MAYDMTNMKIDSQDTPVVMGVEVAKDMTPKYPYGLELKFDADTLEKLGLDDCAVGDQYYIVAKAKVVSTNESESEGGNESKCVCMQITKMKVDHAVGIAKDDEYASKEDAEQGLLNQAKDIMTGKGY